MESKFEQFLSIIGNKRQYGQLTSEERLSIAELCKNGGAEEIAMGYAGCYLDRAMHDPSALKHVVDFINLAETYRTEGVG